MAEIISIKETWHLIEVLTNPYTLPFTPLCIFRTHTECCFEPHKEVNEGFGRWDDVEWWGHSRAVLKITHPQFRASEFPLTV